MESYECYSTNFDLEDISDEVLMYNLMSYYINSTFKHNYELE